VLSIKSKFKNDLTKEQSIDSNKTLLFENVLNLVKISQDINSIELLPIKNKSRDKCSGFVSDSIDYIQMKRSYLRLVFVIEENNN